MKSDTVNNTITWGTVAMGTARIQIRHIVLWLGMALWLLPTLCFTGVHGIAWFAFNISFLIILVTVATTVRAVPLHKLAISFFSGGLAMGICLGIALPLVKVLGDNFPLRYFITVPMEEWAKLLVVLLILWRGRKFSSWTLGATDILLLGAAAGAGFGFMEDSFSHALQKSALNNLSVLLPASELVEGRIIAGHAVWTGLAAGTIGIATHFRHKKAVFIPCLVLGPVITILDHLALNHSRYPAAPAWTQAIFNTLAANGYLALGLFILTLIAAILVDLAVMARSLPKAKEFSIPTRLNRKEPLTALWDCVLDLRRLNYAYNRFSHYENPPGALALTVAILAKRLVNRYLAAEPAKVTAETALPGALISATGEQSSVLNTAVSMTQSDKTLIRPQNRLPESLSQFDDRPLKELIDLPERYQLQEQVSSGGMGIIFQARHSLTGARLAIKVLHPHLAKNKNYLARFEQEARAASNLKHPNIVTVHDFGITPRSIAYLVMEWLDGPSLEKEVETSGPLSAPRFLSVFTQAASALAHAHRKGVIHRDIKPSNIILTFTDTQKDIVKIVDFGIAKLVGEETQDLKLTSSGDVLGSPLFMSPEQCMGGELDGRTDVYSLGCVMYEALCGAPPLTGQNSAQLIHKHINEMPKQPRAINPAIVAPELFEPFLFKCLQKEPSKRFNNMEEMENELKCIAASISQVH